MPEIQVTLLIWIAVTIIAVPFIIKKYRLKDNIKGKKGLPIGTAQFKGTLILIGWIVGIGLLFGLLGMLMG